MAEARKNPDRDAALEAELADLRRQHDRLREEKVRAEEQLASLEQQLRQLEEEALREHGVSDPDALAALLEERRAENERRVAAYRQHIAGVRQGLQDVDQAAEA